MTKTDKIKVKRITIDCVEGPTFLCGPKYAASYEDADQLLRQIAHHGPDLGYYKTDFQIEFEDGEVYEGRYDVERLDRATVDLRKHVRDFVTFCAGLRKPERLTQKQYETILRRGGEDQTGKYKTFLETYEL